MFYIELVILTYPYRTNVFRLVCLDGLCLSFSCFLLFFFISFAFYPKKESILNFRTENTANNNK